MFKVLWRTLKQNIGYIVFVIFLAIVMIIFTWDCNPGNIYIGPAEIKTNNLTEKVKIYAGTNFESNVLWSKKDNLWGISLKFDLSDMDTMANSVHQTKEITGIKKASEEARSNEMAESIHIKLYAYKEIIGEWNIALSEIRPETNTKLVYGEAVTGMKDKPLQVIITTEVEESRSVAISDIQPITDRISANMIMGFMLGIVIVFLILSIIAGKYWDYSKTFLIMGSILAVLWLVAMPYGRVPDEEDHFFRIYEISQGYIVSDSIRSESIDTDSSVMGGENIAGRWMPANLDLGIKQHRSTVRDVIDGRSYVLDRENLVWYSFPNLALYSPISYLPQLVGVFLADLFTESVLYIIYIGRIAGLLVSLIAMFWAIKLAPFKKECFFIIAMLPMTFQQSISLSADNFINALAVLYIGYILYLLCQDEEYKLGKVQLVILWGMTLLIALSKVVYLPLTWLGILIPSGFFGSSKKKHLHTWGYIVLGAALNLLWMNISSIGESASREQIEFILNYPEAFIKIIIRTVLKFGNEVVYEMFGSNMGALNIPVDEFPLLILIVLLVVLAVIPVKNARRFSVREKIWVSVIWMLILAMIWGSMYLGYNPVGNNLIVGFQGRYLIPISLLMLMTLENQHFIREDFNLRKYVYPLTACINLYVLFTVLEQTLW